MSALTVTEVLDTQKRAWTKWSDHRCPNEKGEYRFRASFDLLGMPVTAEWTEQLHLCGMGYDESEWWPLTACHWNGYQRYITNPTLEWSPVQADDPKGIIWHGLDLLPCPFTGRQPAVEAQGQYICAPLWRSEAVWISSPMIPRRRWTDAKAMKAAWNTRVSPEAAALAREQQACPPQNSRAGCTLTSAATTTCHLTVSVPRLPPWCR